MPLELSRWVSGDRHGSWVLIEWFVGFDQAVEIEWVVGFDRVVDSTWLDFGFGLVGLGWCGGGVVVVTMVGG